MTIYFGSETKRYPSFVVHRPLKNIYLTDNM